jgi:L-alanine-DL-glutamate epimerase-like enolase superfamily enzyme
VSALVGGRRGRVATYANCAHHLPPDKLAEKAAGYVKQGHTALKIRGSATYVSLHEATERVKHVREAIGPDVKLMVDVNGTWDVDTAIQQLKRWERYDVYWLEEPVPPDDIPGYVRVRQRAGRTYIVGGEQHVGVMEFRQLIEQGAVDIVQPNAAITGGITDWLRIHALATLSSVPVSPWNLQMVHIHLAAGSPTSNGSSTSWRTTPCWSFRAGCSRDRSCARSARRTESSSLRRTPPASAWSWTMPWPPPPSSPSREVESGASFPTLRQVDDHVSPGGVLRSRRILVAHRGPHA